MVNIGDFVPGLWIDPGKRLPPMPRSRLLSGVRITGLPYSGGAQLNGAWIKSVRRQFGPSLFLPQYEPVLYGVESMATRLFNATDDIKAPLATQLLLYNQRAAVSKHLSCAGRMAGGDAPDWCWFKRERPRPGICEPDGSFAIETRFGLLVGNVYTAKPRLLRTSAALRAWAGRQ